MALPLRLFEGRFGRVVLAELEASAPHSHPEPVILLHYDGPPGEYQVDKARVALSREQIVFLNPGETHAGLRATGVAAGRFVALFASAEWLGQAFPAVFGGAGRRPFPRVQEPVLPRIRRLADTLAVEVINDRFLSSERLEFMLQELLLSIVDGYFARRRAASPLWRGSRFEDSRIRRAIALLRARPNKELNMDELASQVGLSRSRFYDLFQLCTGHSPREYLDMLCVESAIAKLASGSSRIADVSAELGFSAQSNFTRFFLNQVGISPSEYRRAATRPDPAATEPDPTA